MAEDRDQGDLRREFLDQRLKGIGATDSPKLLGLSRWGSPLSVYMDKVGGRPDKPPSLPAWLGKALQSTVGELYTQATGNRLRAVSENRLFTMPGHPVLICHLDFRVWGDPDLLVEAKTHKSTQGYGEDGSTTIPADEWVQCQHEMAVTGAREVHLAVLFGHYAYRTFKVLRDQEFIDRLVERCELFWGTNVLAGIPPVASGLDEDRELLDEAAPRALEPMKQASAEQTEVMLKLALARANRLAAEKVEKAHKNALIQIIGAAEGIRSSIGEITYKNDPDHTETEWELVAKAYKAELLDVLAHVAPGDDPELVAILAHAQTAAEGSVPESLYTTTTEGSRRFNVSIREENIHVTPA